MTEIAHSGVKGMKWGVRRGPVALITSSAGGSHAVTGKNVTNAEHDELIKHANNYFKNRRAVAHVVGEINKKYDNKRLNTDDTYH